MSENNWQNCLSWLVRSNAFPETNKISNPIELAQNLRDGVILCKLLNNILPNCINVKDIQLRPQLAQFLCLKNIRLFLHTCQTHFNLTSSDLFCPDMLYDFSDFEKVIVTLSKLSRCHQSLLLTNGFDCAVSINSASKQQSKDIYKDFEYLADKHEVRETNGKDQSDKNTEDLYEQLCTLKRPAHQIFLTAPKDKREHCIRELVETETNYIKALKDVVTNFMVRMEQELSLHDIRIIYGNIEDLIKIHEKFEKRLCEAAALSIVVKAACPEEKVSLNKANNHHGTSISLLPSDLESRLGPSGNSGIKFNDVESKKYLGNVFLDFADKFLIYGQYCSQLPHAQSHLDKLLENDEKVRLTLWECQMTASQGKFHLRDLLALPVQRILKYHILLKELLKYTSETHEERGSLKLALEAILDLTFYINEVKRDSEGMQLTNDIQRNIAKITMPPNRTLNQYGRLIKDGELKIKSVTDSRIKNRYVFLFDTMMLMCKSTKSDIYNFKGALALEDYSISLPSLPEPGLSDFLQTLSLSRTQFQNLPYNPMVDVAADWKQRLISAKKEVKWSYSWLLISNDKHNVYNLYAKTHDAWFKWMEALATAKDNLAPSTLNETNHAFQFDTFGQPTRCTYCKKLLRGAIYQGYRCLDKMCDFVVHKECIPLTGYSCEKDSRIANDLVVDRNYNVKPPLIPKRNIEETRNDRMVCNGVRNGSGTKEKTDNPINANIVPGLKRNLISAAVIKRQGLKSPSTTDITGRSDLLSNNAFAHRRFRNSLGGSKKETMGLPKEFNDSKRSSNGEFITKSGKTFADNRVRGSDVVRELDSKIKGRKFNGEETQYPRHSVGPLPSHSTTPSAKHYCNLELQDRPWFIGEMSRQEAKNCMQDTPTGTFLVRYSSHQGGNPVITLKFKDEIKHIKILSDDAKGYYISECQYFPNIVELISHYQNTSLAHLFVGINTTLAFPYKTTNAPKLVSEDGDTSTEKDESVENSLLKSSPSTSSSSHTSSRPDSPSENGGVHKSQHGRCNQEEPNRSQESICTSNHTLYTARPTTAPRAPYVSKAIAQFDYNADSDKMISFKRGDKILVVSKEGDQRGWWRGQLLNRAQIGYFPLKYVSEDSW